MLSDYFSVGGGKKQLWRGILRSSAERPQALTAVLVAGRASVRPSSSAPGASCSLWGSALWSVLPLHGDRDDTLCV